MSETLKKPISVNNALALLSGNTVAHRRLRLDEMTLLLKIFKDIKAYTEIGTYYGLSLGLIGLCTDVKYVTCYDTDLRPEVTSIISMLDAYGVEVTFHQANFDGIIPPFSDMILIDADHSYEATLRHYYQCRMRSSNIVLHDVEMPGPGQVFKEMGGAKIVSSIQYDTAPDGKVLPPLGYGILK